MGTANQGGAVDAGKKSLSESAWNQGKHIKHARPLSLPLWFANNASY
jgi:hypothetical protein